MQDFAPRFQTFPGDTPRTPPPSSWITYNGRATRLPALSHTHVISLLLAGVLGERALTAGSVVTGQALALAARHSAALAIAARRSAADLALVRRAALVIALAELTANLDPLLLQ